MASPEVQQLFSDLGEAIVEEEEAASKVAGIIQELEDLGIDDPVASMHEYEGDE